MIGKIAKIKEGSELVFSVPPSKSLLARALTLAARSEEVLLRFGGELCADSAAMVSCLRALGVRIEPVCGGLAVRGGLLRESAELDVGDSGAVARFLTALLAFSGGEYLFCASEQMNRRPMSGLIEALGREKFSFLGEADRLPFRLISHGISAKELAVGTAESTQFASGILLAAAGRPFRLVLRGTRAESPYLGMTLSMLGRFGVGWTRDKDTVSLNAPLSPPREIPIEPDFSSACYLYALSLLCRACVTVRGLRRNSVQGDARFLDLLEARGVKIAETEVGLCADGREVKSFRGFTEDLSGYSDQTMTLAALAPFAESATRLSGISHIRGQESDRVSAILSDLAALGVPASYREGVLAIEPAPIRGGTVESFGDHRVAMAFALMGARADVSVRGAECCRKTFPNFFGSLG